MNSLNSYTCKCLDSYSGPRCQIKVNYCASSPCQNNATCTNLVSSYSCLCQPGRSTYVKLKKSTKFNLINKGYTGINCDQIINLCVSGICQNGGLCLPLLNDIKCLCPKGFTSSRCEIRIDACQSSPCANGAACSSLSTGYK